MSAVLPAEKMPDGEWRNLIEAIHRGKCILVLGPDAVFQHSDDQGPTLAAGLAHHLYKILENKHVVSDREDLFHVARAYLDEQKRDHLSLELEAESYFEEYQQGTSRLNRDLASLPFDLCLSTTHDRHLVNAFRSDKIAKNPLIAHYNFRESRPDKLVDAADLASAERPVVYSLLGSCDDLGSLVLTENDLLEFLVNVIQGTPPLSDYIRERLANDDASFLFVGFGLDQWYLRILLHALKACGHRSKSFAIESDAFMRGQDTDKTVVYYGSEYSLKFYCQSIGAFTAELAKKYVALKGAAAEAEVTLPEGVPRAFLCHCSEDSARVEKLEAELKRSGIATWRDRQNLRGGDRWSQVIPKVLDGDEVNYVVVLQSAAMFSRRNDRSYFHREIEIGLRVGSEYGRGIRFVIPCQIEACDLLPVFEEEKIHCIDLTGPDGIAPLVKTMREDWEKRSAGHGRRNRGQG